MSQKKQPGNWYVYHASHTGLGIWSGPHDNSSLAGDSAEDARRKGFDISGIGEVRRLPPGSSNYEGRRQLLDAAQLRSVYEGVDERLDKMITSMRVSGDHQAPAGTIRRKNYELAVSAKLELQIIPNELANS